MDSTQFPDEDHSGLAAWVDDEGRFFAAPDIEWRKPIVNSVPGALDDVSCRIERLANLFSSNDADFQEAFIDSTIGLTDHHRDRAYSIWMNYVLAGEKLAEIDGLINAINDTCRVKPTSSVGHHVDIRRRAEFIERLEAFKAADAVPVPPDADNETFDAITQPVIEALAAFIKTRSPDLRSLHEKLTVIRQQDSLAVPSYGALDAVFADIEYLARRYEIDGPGADQAEG